MTYKKNNVVCSSLRFFISIYFLSTFTSCANYMIRQECEKINWFQYGQEIAMRGDRASNDEKVNSCRKAEAEIAESQLDQGFKAGMNRYCQPETAYVTGKSGDILNLDLCDPGQYNTIRKKNSDGIKDYCRDGLTAGLSGKKYKNVCAADLEKGFLPQYRLGRKRYLSTLVSNNDGKLRELNLSIDRLSYEKRISDGRLSTLPYVKVGDPDPYADERRRLNDRSWQVGSDLSRKNEEKIVIERQNDEFKKEIATLN